MIYENRKESEIEKKAKKTQPRTFLPQDIDITILKTIPYEYPHREVLVEISTDELTSLCPFSGLPDFAHLVIRYIPNRYLVELKSLKYYLYAFRNVKIYNEHLVNKILEDLKKVIHPKKICVIAEFGVRGGIRNKVIASFPRNWCGE